MAVINGIVVLADPELTNEEIVAIVEEEARAWQQKGKTLAKIELAIDGDEIAVKAVEKSPVRRVRRITGYLSEFDNFNDAKRAECENRQVHLSV